MVGARFWFRLAGVLIACGIAAFVIIALFMRVWIAAGVLGLFVVFGGALLLFAWRYDKRQEARYSDE